MKKLLALVLALVMSMSLVTISNAAFKDADKIDYKEAVDVMNAVGVFVGDEKGNFNAKENLTREQAAKIIAYLELGSKAADALAGGATFTDVASTRWSAGFVGYCAQAGVVNGVGNSKFDPAGQLTALQFGKMLLVELGYDAKAAGMVGSIAEVFPNAAYQRCTVHFYRNALAKVPKSKRPKAAAMLKAIHAMESREASEAKALEVADELDSMRLKEAAKVVRDGYAETLTYTRFPREHWRRIRTNNAIERLNREVRRRTRVVGTFPDGKSALMLVTARLKYVAESEWGSRRYLDVTLLEG